MESTVFGRTKRQRTQEWLDRKLRRAAWGGDTDEVKMLLTAGANVHADDDYALNIAAYFGHVSTMKELLEAGANVHQGGDWALWLAQIRHSTEQLQVVRDAIEKQDALRAREKLERERQENPLNAGVQLSMTEVGPATVETLLREAIEAQGQMRCPARGGAPRRDYIPLPQL
jgi:hypothetical protein